LSDKNKLVKVSRNLYRLSLNERKSLRTTKAGSKTTVALKKKPKRVASKSPAKKVYTSIQKLISETTPSKSPTPKATKTRSPSKSTTPKKEMSKAKKTKTAKPKVKKVGEPKKALKSKSMEASKKKSKASTSTRAEKVAAKGKAASTATKISRRSSPTIAVAETIVEAK